MALRKRAIVSLLAIAVCFGCAGNQKNEPVKNAWIQESNKLAAEYSRSWAELLPEQGSDLGYREYDTRAAVTEGGLRTRIEAMLQLWQAKLKSKAALENDPNVLIDLRVLSENVESSLRGFELEKKYGVIPFEEVSEETFYSLRTLINEQSPPERKRAAFERFKKYVYGFEENGLKAMPSAEFAKYRTEEKIKQFSKKTGPSGGQRFFPLRAEVDNYLKNSAKIVEGIRGLLEDAEKQTGYKDWKQDFDKFKIQVRTYDNWVKTSLRPLARTDHRLPLEMYSLALYRIGHRASPQEIQKAARAEYERSLVEYRALAAEIGKRDGLSDSSPKAVLAHFKKQSVETDPVKIRARYVKADEELTAEIKRRDLMTLPTAPLLIRVASEAESRIQPVPHLNTPPLIGNTGERPEFVVPIGSKDQISIDDFAFSAAAKSLTAHEGRPGHDLQFSAVLDRGVSIIRANYAFNSVNVEGWALYAEWLMEASLSQDERMGLLMARLMRNARMFLDPELHLGLITPEKAKKVITEEVGMSPAWADSELQRYMYRSPGQAPSYYYGYLKLREIRKDAIARMGGSFKERCFHDAVLDAGLLPLEILSEQMKTLTCAK
jgi:hypothetical protein